MLNIKINGLPVDLEAEQALDVVATNPVVDKDKISRAFTFPFTLPNTPNNLHVRNHVHRLDASKLRKDDEGIVEFGGHQLLTGKVKTSTTTNESEEAFMQNIPLDVWQKLGQFKISEILEPVDISGIPVLNDVWLFTADVPPNLYQIIIDGEVFIYDSIGGDDSFDVVTALAALINAVYPGMATAQATNALLLDSTMVNAHAVQLDATLQHLTLTSVVTVGEQAMIRMLTHVEEVFATPIPEYCFPVIRWHELYPAGENSLYGKWVNMCIDGVAFQNVEDLAKRWFNTFIPQVRVPYILDRISVQMSAAGWVGDVFDSEAIQNLIVVSNYCLDKVYYDRYIDQDFYYINGFEQSWRLNDCVPQLTAADFIREICVMFQLTFEYADGSYSFVKSKDRADRPPINLNNKVSRNYSIAKNTANGWVLRYRENPLEKHVEVGQLASYPVGASDIKIEIARTLYMTSEYASSLGGFLKVPVTEHPGAARVFSSGATRSTMPLTFLMEYGQQEAELGNEYIYASHDTTDYADTEIGDFALSIDGDKGLISQWQSGVIEYTDADLISITVILSLGDIQKLMEWKKAKATFYHPFGTVVGMIKSIKARLGGLALGPVRIELLTKRSQ